MKLRVLLFGLITLFGLELPASADVGAWTSSGREWCDLGANEEAVPMPDDATAFAAEPVDAATPPVDEDRAFTTAMDETVSTFVADDARASEFLAIGEALNRESGRVPRFTPAVVEPETAERAGRLAAAVRLTGEAVHAWVDLLQSPAIASLNP